jgi:hypothetical protein
MTMSKKALQRERDNLRERTSCSMCFKPIPDLIGELNQHLKGWANYFKLGYPRKGFRQINTYVRERLTLHLTRRSQRPFRPPKGKSFYEHSLLDCCTCNGYIAQLSVDALSESFWASRMREICTSGSRRGEALAPSPTRLDPWRLLSFTHVLYRLIDSLGRKGHLEYACACGVKNCISNRCAYGTNSRFPTPLGCQLVILD